MTRRWPTALLAAGLFVFAGLPLLLLLARAARAEDLDWWAVWTSADAVRALGGTALTSLGAALFAFLVGVPLALLLVRTDLGLKKALKATFTLPTAIPPFILGMGWVSLANPKAGLLNLALGAGTFDIYGAAGIAFVLGSAGLPLVFLATTAALSRLDSSLEEAARISGASPARTLLTISLPLALPAALSGTALTFLFTASAFGVPYLLGVTATPPTPTLTTRVYGEVLMGSTGLARAAVLSVELLVLAGVVLLVSRWLTRAGEVRLSSGKGLSLRPMPLGRWRGPLTAVAVALGVILVVLPLLAVALTSVQPVWGQLTGLTTKHWGAVLSSPRTISAAGRSVLLAFSAATLVTGLGLAVASTRRRWLEALAGAPYAVPGTVLALGLLVAFSRDVRFIAFERVAFVLALGNTLWLLLVAYAVKHLAFGARSASDALAQVDPSLAEAARIFGASRARAFVDATWPQLKGALGAAFLITFLVCMTELTLSVLLIPTGADVLGTLLFELQSYADPGAAAVIACAFVLLLLLAQAAQALLTRREAR
ncbi:MAG: iron ABC transporter permease [Myxococcales bacterium]|nr:iron ABC transporter permease [Myxococcales bacterium]